MASPVKLYVYDLSHGLARSLSQQYIGKQIDGVWHTSVVVFGKEIFYGQGISITAPGGSPHGTPLQILDMGETALDQETFDEYLAEMRHHYTADKYHLLEFNCNSFTNDVVGFLTGGSIPDFIKNLPAEFLSAPFMAGLRPTTDASPRAQIPTNATASSSNQPVSSRPQPPPSTSYLPTPAPTHPSTPVPSSTPTTPVHLCTNTSSFHSILRTHRAVIAYFTRANCGPCAMISPVFEQIAREYCGRKGMAFLKIDTGVGMGGDIAAEFSIRVVPTFIFFLDGKKTHELKGADPSQLYPQVDLLIYQAYPPHPHTTLSLPAMKSFSLNPILFTQVPALDTVVSKLISFIDASPSVSQVQLKQFLTKTVVPYLKARFVTDSHAKALSATSNLLISWGAVTVTLVDALPVSQLFPLVDMWRLALLDPTAATWCASVPAHSHDPILALLTKASSALSSEAPSNPRSYILTVLRLFSNGFSSSALARRLMSGSGMRASVTALLVHTLLHEDSAVRTAAASLAFNAAVHLQKGRIDALEGGQSATEEEDGDWEVEMISAVVEAIDREKESEEVVHRLVASLGLLLRFSPFYDTQLGPLLEALQGQAVLERKLKKGGCGEQGVKKKEVRRLVEEVAGKLCS